MYSTKQEDFLVSSRNQMNVASLFCRFTVKEGAPENVWTLQRRICAAASAAPNTADWATPDTDLKLIEEKK
jgi:hypothetical protein